MLANTALTTKVAVVVAVLVPEPLVMSISPWESKALSANDTSA